jgi:hypothetical protein
VVVNDEFSHLHAPYRAYALLSASERIQWIRQDRWIHYSRAEQVLNRLSDLQSATRAQRNMFGERRVLKSLKKSDEPGKRWPQKKLFIRN